jgi:alpha-D-xyloside xylohydrolase
MHRAMFMEFPQDHACEPIDRQYMLGDSLLIAPVFKQNGEVAYYLPKGTWTNYLTGEVIEGEKWVTEVHDYFSLPLMVRPNTVLPVGNCDSKPDYNYAEGVTLKLYQIAEGAELITLIPDINGQPSMKVTTKRVNHVITVTTEGENTNWFVEVVGQKNAHQEKKDNVLVIRLEQHH